MPHKKELAPDASGPARRRLSSDLRRAFEHLTRVDILEGTLTGPAFCDVSSLAALGLQQIAAGRDRDAADLLCAAEHLCFAAHAPTGYAASATRLFRELRHAIAQEYQTLLRSAESHRTHAPRHGLLAEICVRTLDRARSAYAELALGSALELAHAADLLTQIAERDHLAADAAASLAS